LAGLIAAGAYKCAKVYKKRPKDALRLYKRNPKLRLNKGVVMLRENLQDSAEILFNILNQPLDVPGATMNVSLLAAALNFDSAQPENTDLSRIMQEFVKYPESTQALIQELELLYRDLENQ